MQRKLEPSYPAQGFEPRWFALVTLPRHEKRVSSTLHNKGFETFLPTYRRRTHYGVRCRETELPLFPGYTFCRFDPLDRLPILVTPGVLRVVGAGRVPVPIDDREIAAIQRAAGTGAAMEPSEYPAVGRTAWISSGPLAGMEGIVTSVKAQARFVISVTLLQRSVAVEIDAERIQLT